MNNILKGHNWNIRLLWLWYANRVRPIYFKLKQPNINRQHTIIVYRNLIAATDKVFLIWSVTFPAVYIFVVGYAYSALIGDNGIVVGLFIHGIVVSYTLCAVVLGSIFFGSFTIILSTKINTSEAHNVINTGLFLFFAFVSSAFTLLKDYRSHYPLLPTLIHWPM